MRAREFVVESSKTASAEQVWDYVSRIHPEDQQGGGFLRDLILRNPQYELKRVPLSNIHIPDQEYDDEEQDSENNDPYNRAMFVDPEHAGEYSQHYVDRNPIVIDARGYILDGNHRAWAAAELLNRSDIMAWVPAKKLTESQSVKQEIKDFIDSLTPADVGVEEFPGYRIHYEGFTDDCKLSSNYQKNPNKVYKQVYQDFIDREGGRKPVKSSMVGDEEYPILYSVFKAPQSKSVDTAEKAYSIAYKKKQPWPRGSREEKLIRSDWQLSGLYDQYVLKQGVAEVVNKELWHPERMFKQRVPIGAYEFEAREAIGGMGDYDADALTIIAYDPKKKNKVIGNANFVVKGRGSKRSLVSDDTYVDPKYRGEGIATMMYAYAKSLGNDIKSSNIQTPMGKKMWANWGSDAKHLRGVAEDAQLPGDFKLMGQNLFLKNLARNLKQRYPDATVKLSSDRVTAYHNKGDDEALTVMGTEVMDSGYIGVGLDDAFTESFQGVLVPTIKQTTEQLLAANPGMKPALFLSTDNWNPDAWTHIAAKLGYRLVADDEELAEGQLTESAIFLNPNTVIVGQKHSQPLELSPETLKKVQAIAAQHGAWYEGNGADRAYTRGVIDRYVGSFDDEVAKTASPNDPKWIYVLFANVDANNRIQRVGVDPKDTIFNRLMDTAQDNSFQGIGFTASALKKFLSMASEGKYDFVKMSQLPATQENLTRFLKAGEALMWPSNWEQYPNRAGKIARAATVDTRDQYLATRKAGVYVVGAGHLKAVQDISGKQGVEENFADGKKPGRKGLAKRSGVNTKASVSSLRKTAKNSSGEKQRMAHWLANMKAGRAKAKK